MPKEEASYEPIENLSQIQKEIKEYDLNYLLSIQEIEVNPIKVNFIKKINKKISQLNHQQKNLDKLLKI